MIVIVVMSADGTVESYEFQNEVEVVSPSPAGPLMYDRSHFEIERLDIEDYRSRVLFGKPLSSYLYDVSFSKSSSLAWTVTLHI